MYSDNICTEAEKTATPQDDYLCGWKSIEHFMEMSWRALLRRGYPIRKDGRLILARKSELLAHKEKLFDSLEQLTPQSYR